MFPNDLDRFKHPLKTRFWGVVLGSLVMFAAGAALISPRTLPFTSPFLLLAVVQALYRRRQSAAIGFKLSGGSLLLIAFTAYVAASAIWSDLPRVPLGHAAGVALCFAGCGIAARTFLSVPRREIFHIGEGVWMGVTFGLVYLLIEILTKQSIKIYLYNFLSLVPGDLRPPAFFTWRGGRLISIAPDDLKRSIALATMFLWPSLLAIRGTAPAMLARWGGAAIFALAGTVIFLGPHSSSKGAFIGAAALFLITECRRLWGERLLKFGWVAACLAVIPMALLLHRVNLQNAKWVQPSMQHRIVIWNYTAEQTLKAPFTGIGAGMMYEKYGSQIIEKEPESYDPRVPHAHNLYLQIWFELGVFGAALLTLLGLAILERIRRLGPTIAPYAHATFASAAIMASSSYGMWQEWFLIGYALTVIIFAIAVRSMVHKERMPGMPVALS